MRFLTKRGERYYFFRRVPADLKKYDPRPHIRIALKTADEAEAERRVIQQNDMLEKYWQGLVKNKKIHGQDESWKDAVSTARIHGFAYKGIAELADDKTTSIAELTERLRVIEQEGTQPRIVKALLGTQEKPSTPISAGLEAYFELCQDRLVGKSKDFIRKWENPRKRAVANFITALGDKNITDISRRDILDFKSWWLAKISKESMNPDTANKDLTHLKDILRVIMSDAEIDVNIPTLFAETTFRSRANSRVPFEAEFVQHTILKAGMLDGLNVEAQALIYIMADTGARVSEVIGLLPEDIILDAEIPHIFIRPNKKRTLKNAQSERQMPLVGAALHGIRMVRGGFPRYAAADSASNLVNQYFENHGIKLSPMHTLYSLRHTFKDRLRDIAAPEEVIDNLMGHAHDKPKYGRGHSLETKALWLNKIAFKMPNPLS